MAMPTVSPYASARDMLSLEDISEQLCATGHPASVTTLRRWIARYGIATERRGRKDFVSYSDVLLVHREEVRRRNA